MKKPEWLSLRTLDGIVIRILIAALTGAVCLFAVYALPIEPIDRHAAQSAPIFAEEGIYPVLYDRFHSRLDNWTDATMLLEAANDAEGSVFERAMLVQRGWLNKTPPDTMIEHYINGAAFRTNITYGRYWHGYLLFLKPLLAFLDYGQIRLLNGVCQTCLSALLIVLLIRNKLTHLVLPHFISILMLMPAVLANNLEYSPCYYILTAAGIAVIVKRDQPDAFRRWINLFACIGIATPYFDFLTYPVATFGIPAVYWLAKQTERNPKFVLPRLASLLVSWGIGYAGMWACKWVLGSIITGADILQDAGGAIALRTSREDLKALIACLRSNVSAFLRTPGSFAALAYLLVTAVLLFRLVRRRSVRFSRTLPIALPYLLIAALPFMWYAAAANHSSTHWWFTCKALVVSAFSVMSMLAEIRRAGHRSAPPDRQI